MELGTSDAAETDIAIVGMAGRFPGAGSVDELWRRVEAGDDCLTDLDEAALRAAGVSDAALADPDYVRRDGVLDDLEMFDAGFFGVGPRDASIMDPQHRHFLECAWEALETAGHVPESFGGTIGVFAGCGMNTYMINNLLTNQTLVDQVGMFLLRHTANDKDFLTTTLSYKLDLRGPSVNVQTACSTSLVAVHLAAQSLLSFECDLALAGGVTIEVPHGDGYQYHEGEILSPTGHCRAFDESSDGTVLTGGVGVVALRRLADALDDGDDILAVVKGSAVNNDGQRKVGYLAPSVDGHADVVKEALAVAGLTARDLQLLEAHGTGTAVGDPIEVAALTEAFRASTDERGFCRLVSTKPNIGHLDTAAGVASLIKVVQALRHRTLPPLANHTAPSPLLDLAETPFVLSAEATPWPGDRPRRAGVSSLGVGGTNAHVIVEEAPARPATPAATGEQLVVLSGLDDDAVQRGAARLASFLEEQPDTNLADASHTLVTARRAMARRRVVVAPDTASAASLLATPDRERVASGTTAAVAPGVVFLFPGGGAQYRGMGAGLDGRFATFRDVMADGIERVREKAQLDLAPLLRPDAAEHALRETTVSLPAVFLTSVAMARQWMSWGVEPSAFAGHSLGEYVAAHLAGVLSFDDALDLVIARSALMGQASGADGAMLAVPLGEHEVRAVLDDALSLATINADDECVVAGPARAIEALQRRLADRDVSATLIPLSAAAHSSLLDPVLPRFLEVVRAVDLRPPERPYVSNLTGTWITAEQATDPQRWVDHLRHTVRFTDCLRTVQEHGPVVFVEAGPGHSLSSYARRQAVKPIAAIPTLRHQNQAIDDTAFSLLAAGKAWIAGVDVDLDQFTGTGRRTVRLPGYAFKREPHWIGPGAGRAVAPGAPTVERGAELAVPTPAARPAPTKIADVGDWFWAPSWIERPPAAPPSSPIGPWLIIGDESDPLVAALGRALGDRGATVAVTPSPHPAALTAARSVLVVGVTRSFDAAVERWLTHASAVARALGAVVGEPTLLAAVTRSATDAAGPAAHPNDALATGVVRTAAHEYPELRTLHVDVALRGDPTAEATAVLAEVFGGADTTVALRDGHRLVPEDQRVRLDRAQAPTFRRGGNYLVTGGLGGVGFTLAEHLVRDHDANIVVTAARHVPDGAARAEWLATHAYEDATSRRIRRLARLESHGTKVAVVAADVADVDEVRGAVEEAERLIGTLDGAIHAAGELRDRPIELATHEDHEVVVGAKARGAVALADVLGARGAELLVLISSTSTSLHADGQSAYVAANSVLDALAGRRGELRVVTVNYGLWSGLGIAADLARRARLGLEPGEPVVHPFLAELHRGRDGTIQLVGTLAADHHWALEEHRTRSGVAVLPGTAHLELFLAASELSGSGPAVLEGIALLEPVVVPDGATVTVRVTIGAGDGRRSIELESDGGEGRWRTHSEGELIAVAGALTSLSETARPDGAATVDPLAGPDANLELGPRWHSVVDAWRRDDRAGGTIALPERYDGERERWQAHPALVDVATAFGVVLGERPGALYVPVGYGRVQRFGPLPDAITVQAKRRPSSSEQLLEVDLVLADRHGACALRIDELQLRPLDEPATLAAAAQVHDTSPAPHAHWVAPLVGFAEAHGITAEDGSEALERLLASHRPRLIASSMDLDELRGVLDVRPESSGSAAADDPLASAVEEATVLGVMRSIWVDLLGVQDIGDDDDFFDLGGHSLIAIRLMSRIAKQLGVRFQLATIFDAPTIDGLTAKVLEARPDLDAELAAAAAARPLATAGAAAAQASGAATSAPTSEPHRSLVTISAVGERAPLFIVHGAGGNVLFLWTLARAMAGSRPIYGFQASGVDGQDMPDATVEEMARRYVTELRLAHRGPYLLGGYSGGGIVTVEMVRQLQALGEEVTGLLLFDSVPPGKATPGELTAMKHIVGHVRRHGLTPLRPFIKRYIKNKLRFFVRRDPGRVAEIDAYERELGQRDVEALGFVNLYYYFSAAADRYQIGRVDVDAALFKAEWVWPLQPDDYYWGRHLRGGLTVVTVPGDHHAMFYPENAPRLAEAVTAVLEARGW